MPVIFGTKILTASYDKDTLEISITAQALGENEYAGVSKLEISEHGLNDWSSNPITLSSWADEAAAGTLDHELADGKTYDIRATSSDGEQDTASEIIDLSSSVMVSRLDLALSFGL
jgi:hypothetical protein